ncbi:hypothetical protein D3C80_910100 [compost metagenome]
MVLFLLVRIDDRPGHRSERHAIFCEDYREIHLLGPLAEGMEVGRRLHMFTDHHPGQARFSQALHVLALLQGVSRNAEPRGHQHIALSQPFGGVGQFADMCPAHFAVKAFSTAQEA